MMFLFLKKNCRINTAITSTTKLHEADFNFKSLNFCQIYSLIKTSNGYFKSCSRWNNKEIILGNLHFNSSLIRFVAVKVYRANLIPNFSKLFSLRPLDPRAHCNKYGKLYSMWCYLCFQPVLRDSQHFLIGHLLEQVGIFMKPQTFQPCGYICKNMHMEIFKIQRYHFFFLFSKDYPIGLSH